MHQGTTRESAFESVRETLLCGGCARNGKAHVLTSLVPLWALTIYVLKQIVHVIGDLYDMSAPGFTLQTSTPEASVVVHELLATVTSAMKQSVWEIQVSSCLDLFGH